MTLRTLIILWAMALTGMMASAHAAGTINYESSDSIFRATLELPTRPVQGKACSPVTIFVENKAGQRLAMRSAQLIVRWYSGGRRQTAGAARVFAQPISLTRADGRLLTTTTLVNRRINICGALAGDNRFSIAVAYTQAGQRARVLSLAGRTCVASPKENCETKGVLVLPSQFLNGAYPLKARLGATCPVRSREINVSSTEAMCVDSDVFPPASLFDIAAGASCPAGTTDVANRWDSDRKLCMAYVHGLELSWHQGDTLPQTVRGNPKGQDGYIPSTGRANSRWYLRVRSRAVEEARRYVRVTRTGRVLYAITLAGSPGKLPGIPGGFWRMTHSTGFLANAYPSEGATGVYCGVRSTTARCSRSRDDLVGYEDVIETLFVKPTPGLESTQVMQYGNTDVVTRANIVAGDVPRQVRLQPGRLLGYTSTRAISEPEQSTRLSARVLVNGLEKPWGMAIMPNGDMLVTEKPGRLRRIVRGVLDPIPVRGLPSIAVSGQGGLLDVALDPDFSSNRRIFLSYSAGVASRGVGTEVSSGVLRGRTLTNVKTIFVALPKSRGFGHFGSRLGFDAQKRLYITLGDRKQRTWSQDLTSHVGSVVRINRDGSVPVDNPFTDVANARPEIFSYGHRNPQGLTIDKASGRIWVHEHGPKGGDEINLIRSGQNYGWPLVSYGEEYTGGPVGSGYTRPDLADPSWFWTPSIAPSGMGFYPGSEIPEFQNSLLAGALKSKLLASLETSGDNVVSESRWLEGRFGRVRDVTVGADGSVYLLTDAVRGQIVKISP